MPLTVSHHRLVHTYLFHWGVRLCAPLISETSQAEERKRDSELRAPRGAHLIFLQRTWGCCWTPVCLAWCQKLWKGPLKLQLSLLLWLTKSDHLLQDCGGNRINQPRSRAVGLHVLHLMGGREFVTRLHPQTSCATMLICAQLVKWTRLPGWPISPVFLLGRLMPSSSRKLKS